MSGSKDSTQHRNGRKQPRQAAGNNRRTRYSDNCAGVSIFQFALTFPILMVFVLTLVDFSRILLVKALLNKGAEDGVALAVKIPNFEIDIRNFAAGSVEYARFQQARNLIADAATRLPRRTLITPSSDPTSSYFTPYRYVDTLDAGATVNPPPYDVAILRPGESVEIKPGSGNWLYHSTYAPAAPGVPAPQSPELLMKSEPIVVEMRATVVTFSPVLRDVTVAGRAMGYREENIPRGPIKRNIGPPEPASTPVAMGPKFTPFPAWANPTPTPAPGVCTERSIFCMAFCAASSAPNCPVPDPLLAFPDSSGNCSCSESNFLGGA